MLSLKKEGDVDDDIRDDGQADRWMALDVSPANDATKARPVYTLLL